MSHRTPTKSRPLVTRQFVALLLVSTTLMTGACKEPGDTDGVPISATELPADTLLDLACADVGINLETCVLDDPENPFVDTVIVEFDVNNEEAFNKFALADSIPAGPTGAKARFYFWATALARRPIGENQYFTARALHELYTYSGDPIVQEQALKAYRSVLDNFFSSAVFFACFFRDGVFRGCPPPDLDPALDEPAAFAVPLNELTADALYRTDATGFTRLIPGDPIFVLDRLASWGYAYQPATAPNFDNGVVSVVDG